MTLPQINSKLQAQKDSFISNSRMKVFKMNSTMATYSLSLLLLCTIGWAQECRHPVHFRKFGGKDILRKDQRHDDPDVGFT